jgi:hypothetical protein
MKKNIIMVLQTHLPIMYLFFHIFSTSFNPELDPLEVLLYNSTHSEIKHSAHLIMVITKGNIIILLPYRANFDFNLHLIVF